MELSIQQIGDVLEVTVQSTRIDAVAAVQFKDGMRAAVEGARGRVLLNLTNVDFIDSSGLGAIVSSMKQISPPARLELVGLSPKVEKVFRLTRMDTVFNIYDTLDNALASQGAA